jgi:Protein of unknown function (DUF2442)
MNKHHDIGSIRFDGDVFEITVDGTTRRFELQQISHPLHRASDAERKVFEVSPSGYGIHWPLLDEDISIDALLGIVNAPARNRKTA